MSKATIAETVTNAPIGMAAARTGPPSKRPRYVSVVLPAEIWPRLDILKDAAQDEGLSLSSRQRIGRDGCITALLGWFMTQDYETQITILSQGIESVKKYPSVMSAGAIGKALGGKTEAE